MKNFKEIADKCLVGELRGIFINRRGDTIPSDILHKWDSIKYPYIYWETNCINRNGNYFYNEEKTSDYDIIDFIPDNMQNKIEIDIPEGKLPVMEQTESGVVITWKDKELTYGNIFTSLFNKDQHINASKPCTSNCNTNQFNKKVEVLRKLTNIRNYFGGDKPTNLWALTINSALKVFPVLCGYRETNRIYFETQEHAEQAIKMLGDELKYLFEPW